MIYNYGNCYAVNGELYHHGVKGMRWGVRKSNYPKTSFGYRHKLNRLDQNRVENEYKAGKYKRKFDKADAKVHKEAQRVADRYNSGKKIDKRYTITKNPNRKGQISSKDIGFTIAGYSKLSRLNRKREDAYFNRRRYEANAKGAKQLINQYIRMAKFNGYSVESRQVKRLANKGEYSVASALAGPIAGLSVATYVDGKAYRVRKNR